MIIEDRLVGVIYLSRTPSNFLKELYKQRWNVLLAGIFILLATLSIAMIFVRTVKRPIELLQERSERIGSGDRSALLPQHTHGSQEVAQLAERFQAMAQNLFDRSDYINTFATHVSHELKSPLTSIQGAAELLRDQVKEMSPEQHSQFLENILKDTDRSVLLLDRLRDLARADNPMQLGSVTMGELLAEMRTNFPEVNLGYEGETSDHLPMAMENAMIVFSNLIENSANHNASYIKISSTSLSDRLEVKIEDDGDGISPANAEKIFDLFFTTRRKQSGTGMGLGIVQAMLRAHGGDIKLESTKNNGGTTFVITFPRAF